MTAVLTRAVDGTAAALDTISARLVEREGEQTLKAQIAAQSDRADFVEDCIAEMAMRTITTKPMIKFLKGCF